MQTEKSQLFFVLHSHYSNFHLLPTLYIYILINKCHTRHLKLNGLEMGIEVKEVHNGTQRSAKVIFKLLPTKLLKYKASYIHQHKSNDIISFLIYLPF